MNRTTAISDRYDVVVVGARAAGASTAMLLARRGLSVLAIDRSRYGADTVSTHSLAKGGVMQLSRWGLLDALRAVGTPPAATTEFRYGGEPVAISVGDPDGDVDGLYSPRRTVLDALLVDAAIDAGAHIVHGATMSGLTRSGGAVDGVEIDGARIGRRRVAARWVVGADGVRSRVARDVGARCIHTERSASAYVYAYWSGLEDDVITNHFDVAGLAAGVFPTNDGQACVWIAMPPQRFAAGVRGNLARGYHRALRSHPGLVDQLCDARCQGGYRGFAGVPGFLREAYGDGWALVGDAGYFKDPLSAHGITDAFVGAELLARAIDAERHGTPVTESLGEYQRERDRLASLVMPPTAALAALDLSPDQAAAQFRLLSRALRAESDFISAQFPASPKRRIHQGDTACAGSPTRK